MPKKRKIKESDLMPLIAAGYADKEIASQLGVNKRTVEYTISRLLKETGCRNRVELAMKWQKSTL